VHSVPQGAFGHIPNTDPRLLNLRPPEGFDHAHDKIAKEAQRRVIPPHIPPNKMHDTYQQYVLGTNQSIDAAKRSEIYGPGGTPPPDITAQSNALRTDSPPPPSEQARLLARGAVYGPGGTPPPDITQQRLNLENNKPQPPGCSTAAC